MLKNVFDLTGKVAIVTGGGANGGIGHSIALGLAQYGADVLICDIDAEGGLITKEEIKIKIRDIANNFLIGNYDKKELNFVIVLNGAKVFANAFIKEILKIKRFKINKYPVRLSSYSGKTSKKVKLVKAIKKKIKDNDVYIIEDIVDTGKTLRFLKGYLKKDEKKKVKFSRPN